MKNEKDILRLFELLNNHEVFTPVGVVNDMLDLLPIEVFSDPYAKFLDPACKSGVFLREISYRLFEGLNIDKIIEVSGVRYNLLKPKDRIDHILKNMIYGIATSEVTSYVSRRTLYGVMFANVDKSIKALNSFQKSHNYEDNGKELDKFISLRKFNEYFNKDLFGADNASGNIFYPTELVADMINNGVDVALEDMAYPFIDEKFRDDKIKELLEMKFDVIIGNPPYQINSGGHGAQATPIYNVFVENAIEMKPSYVCMITPSRWMQGGMGLKDFRDKILNDTRMSKIIDFKVASNCFPSVDIKGGVNYFLWDKKYNGLCEYHICSKENGIRKIESKKERKLNEYSLFIRDNFAISIIEKIKKMDSFFLSSLVRTNAFNLPTNFKEYNNEENKVFDLKLYGNKQNMKKTNGIGYINKDLITKNIKLIDKHKVFIPKAMGKGSDGVFGKAFYGEPNSVCTFTYVLLKSFNTKLECNNLIKYLNTNFVSFLISLLKITQDAMKGVYALVPVLDMTEEWTDEKLYKKYNLTQEEINYIESSIKEMK